MGRNYNRDPTTGVLSVFDFVQSRKYYGLQIPIASLIETLASWWTYQKYHTDRYDPNGYIQGRKTGLHLNFIPKYKIQIRRDADGGTIIQLDYWARIRKTGIVAAFVTYGVTAAIGAGTLSYHVMEAKHFLQAFWEWFDGSYQVVKVEVLINEEKTALQEEGYDENGNVSSKTVHNTTTNNYYNTYQDQMPQSGGYPQPPPVTGYSTTSTSSKTVVKSPKSSGVVYPVTSPPTPEPIPYPAAAGGGSYSSSSSYNSTSSSSSSSGGSKYPSGGYQTTITSHTTSTAPAYGSGVYGTPAYNARFAPPPPTVGAYGGVSPYGYNTGYNNVGAMGYGQYGNNGAYSNTSGTSQYGNNGAYSNTSGVNQYGNSGAYSNTSGTSQYGRGSGINNNSSSSASSSSSTSSSSYGNNNYSGVPLDSLSKLSISGQGSGTGGTQQQQDKFVQSLFGSEPSHKSNSSNINKNLPPQSTATLSGGANGSNPNINPNSNGYNSSLPPYPSTASTNTPTPPPISHANLSNANNTSPSSGVGQYGNNVNSNTTTGQQGPYATGSYLDTGDDKKHQDVDYKSLKHGGLGFGYTYDHLKEELKRKSENLNHTNPPSHGTANN